MTKIKICGITNYFDAKKAVDLGVDFLGFNFYENSPRFIDLPKAKQIIKNLTHSVKIVGIFVNEDLGNIREAVIYCNLDIVQLSGDESPDFISELKKIIDKNIIKSVRIRNKNDLQNIQKFKSEYILLDSFTQGVYGGTGKHIDLKILKKIKTKKIFLSGGLNESNVMKAIEYAKPFAVDVCSGIEKSKGKKDYKKNERIY